MYSITTGGSYHDEQKKNLKHIFTVFLICITALVLAGISRLPVKAAGPHEDTGCYLGIDFADYKGMKYLLSSYDYYKISKVSGATYDKKTNTLTLKNAKLGSQAFMEVSNMGTDFKIKLVGSSSIGNVYIMSWEKWNSVTFTGSGTLEVNAAEKFDTAISFSDWTGSTSSKCKFTVENGPKMILHNGYYGCITFETNTTKASTKISVASCTYTGLAQKPNVTVKYKGKKLSKGSDYTVAYSNNKSAGSKAKVTITGKGLYKGIITKTFTIKKRSLTYSKITASVITSSYRKAYTGTAKKPTVKVRFKRPGSTAITLKKGTAYTLSYKNNVNAGTGKIIIKGIGNYTGTKTLSFTISKAGQDITADQFPLYLTAADIGTQIPLNFTGIQEEAELISVTSDAPDVAVVSEDGIITIVGTGAANIGISFAATANYKACDLVGEIYVQEGSVTPVEPEEPKE